MKTSLITGFLFFVYSCLYSQTFLSVDDRSGSVLTDSAGRKEYQRVMLDDNDFINGRTYHPYYLPSGSNPLFKSSTMLKGTIFSNGRIFQNLNIYYDLYKDQLVLNHISPHGEVLLINLNRQTLDSFLVSTDRDTTKLISLSFPENSKLKSGYYEIPYRGKMKLLIKHESDLIKKGGADEYVYIQKRYLFINGDWVRIGSFMRFKKQFDSKHVSLIKKYLKSLNIYNFRTIPDDKLVQLLRYCETI